MIKMQFNKKIPKPTKDSKKQNKEINEYFLRKLQTKKLIKELTLPTKATIGTFFSSYQNNWLFQKFNSKLMLHSKKCRVETLFFLLFKQKFWKNQKQNHTETFLDLFLIKLLINRPRLELSKKSKKKGKSSAKAKKRQSLIKSNRFLVPNLMPKNKQIRITLSWLINAIKTPIPNIKNKDINSDLMFAKKTLKKEKSKLRLKGKKKLEAEIKEDKRKRRILLQKKKNKKYISLPLKKKMNTFFLQIFNLNPTKSFFFKKKEDYILLTGKQSLLNLKRWK